MFELPSYTHIQLTLDNRKILTVKLNRPEVHNAFNEELISNLTECAGFIEKSSNIRGIVLTGAGKSFCAGADLNYMQKSKNFSYEENVLDATKMGTMFRVWNHLSKPVIGKINGTTLGGGTGLLAACDITITVVTAKFGFTEVKLGIMPAVISQFVISKIGFSAAREFFLTGTRFSAETALKIGLVNYVVADEKELETKVAEIILELLSSGPKAITASKELIRKNQEMNHSDLMHYSIEKIANLRVSEEAQEGISAFLEKRPPTWKIEK